MSVEQYDDLINSYVEKVKHLPNVRGIAKFGSVSTPGLSDIDLVLTLADQGPCPPWNELSLLNHASGHPAEQVVAHDVFLLPESVAQKADTFFYIEHSTTLSGKPLGGESSKEPPARMQSLITLDYLIHRVETLCSILTSRRVALRTVLLFISTIRHSCVLASDLGTIAQTEKATILNDIARLRQESIKGTLSFDSLNRWPERLIELLWKLIIDVGTTLGLSSQTSRKTWAPSIRQTFVNSNARSGSELWQKSVLSQRNHRLSRYVRIAPIPAIAFGHVRSYFQPTSDSSEYLLRRVPRLFRDQPQSATCEARKMRVESVVAQWKLIERTGFYRSSGIGYMGFAAPPKTSIRNQALSVLGRTNAALHTRLNAYE